MKSCNDDLAQFALIVSCFLEKMKLDLVVQKKADRVQGRDNNSMN